MKKSFTLALMLLFGVANAQNYLRLNITEIQDWQSLNYCATQYDSVVIEKEPGCTAFVSWSVRLNGGNTQGYQTDEIVLVPGANSDSYNIMYYSNCSISSREFWVNFSTFEAPYPWAAQYMWKRVGDQVTLEAWGGYSYQWSTGATDNYITVTEPGTYWVRIYNDCGELYDTIQVRDNVEVELATCDLETNLNMVTWQTTLAQAEYVSQVEVKRDGLTVGTAPYTDGYFLDNIGSDAASRTYTVTALATDGTPCPITSYPKETIHMAYLTEINNTIEVNWNATTGYELIGYNICEWNATDGTLTTIDYVGASVNSYTCQQSQFAQGYIVIQGVEAGKDGETRLLSNRSLDLVGIEENGPSASSGTLTVYPNPAKSAFTVEGTGQMTITNVLGQAVLTRDIDGKETIELPRGIYFVKLNGATRKIVVK